MFNAAYKILCYAYKVLFRGMLYKKINNPKAQWDDITMKAADIVFQYKGENK
jgi:hypothetical protein